MSGFKYYVLFLDDFTHVCGFFLYMQNLKCLMFLLIFTLMCKINFNPTSNSFNVIMVVNSIINPILPFLLLKALIFFPYTSQQNGKDKRTVRIVNNIICSLLFQAYLPPKFWVEALLTTVHTLNLFPSSTITNKTAFKLLFGHFPSHDHLRVFGCLCYPNLSGTVTHKLSPRSSA